MAGNDRDDMIRRRRAAANADRRYRYTGNDEDYSFDMDEVERIERRGREGLSRRREDLGNDAGRLIGRGDVRGNAGPGSQRMPERQAQTRGDIPARRRRSEVLGAAPEERRTPQRPAQGQRPVQSRQRPAQGQQPLQSRQRPSQGQRPVQSRQRPVQGQQSAQNRQPAAQQQRPVQQQRSVQQRPSSEYRRAQDYGSDAGRLASRRPSQPSRRQQEVSYDPIDRDEIARMMAEDERSFAAKRRRAAAAAQSRRARSEREYYAEERNRRPASNDRYDDRGYYDGQEYYEEPDYYAGRGGYDADHDYLDEDDYGSSYTGRTAPRRASRASQGDYGRDGGYGRGGDHGRGGRGGRGNNGRDDGGRGGRGGRSGRPKKKHRALKVVLAIVIILAVLVIGGMLMLKRWYSRGYQGEANVIYNDIDPNYDVWDDYLSILVLGTDGTEGDVNGGDVDILVNINKETGEIRMLSFYRDLYLADETGYTDKLTNIFRHGDSISAINALNVNYDTRINEYVTMGWDNVSEAIDLLGGVEVNVPVEMIIDLNGYIENTAQACGVEPEYVTEPGLQNLTGIQAVSYCRIRYTDVPGYSSGDFGRSERQREVLSALFQKAKSGSPLRMINVARTIWPKIQTSLSLNETIALVPILRTMNLADTAGFPRSDEEVDHRGVGRAFGASVVYSTDTLSDVSWIYEYLFDLPGYEPSAQAREYAAVVASEVE